jgi:hypothetical protein
MPKKLPELSKKFLVFVYANISDKPVRFEFTDLEEAKKIPFNYMREIQLIITNSDKSETRMIIERVNIKN